MALLPQSINVASSNHAEPIPAIFAIVFTLYIILKKTLNTNNNWSQMTEGNHTNASRINRLTTT